MRLLQQCMGFISGNKDEKAGMVAVYQESGRSTAGLLRDLQMERKNQVAGNMKDVLYQISEANSAEFK